MGFFIDDDSDNDVISFSGNFGIEMSMTCYQAIYEFVQAIKKNRSDEETIRKFIKYLQETANNTITLYVDKKVE